MFRKSSVVNPARRNFVGVSSVLALGGVIGSSALVLPGQAMAADEKLKFEEMYKTIGPLGMEYSQKLQSLNGKKIQILGYMAPPLKPDANFFVLTRVPVALCPFCDTDDNWPSDIVVIYLKEPIAAFADGSPMAIAGTLELGSKTDSATGFVSLVRVVNATATAL